jgi:hypothetical protein
MPGNCSIMTASTNIKQQGLIIDLALLFKMVQNMAAFLICP